MKKEITLALAFACLLASVFASCVELSAPSTTIEVPQYEVRSFEIAVKQLCRGDIELSVEGDIPISFSKNSLDIPQGNTETVTMLVSPGPAAAGHYGLILTGTDGKLGLAVTVTESDADPLMLVFPIVMTASGSDPVSFEVDIRNDGDRQMNNVIVFMEKSGERTYNEDMLSLSPGDSKTVRFELGMVEQGKHTIEVTAVSGDFIKKRQLNLEVGSASGPVSAMIRVDSYGKDGYTIEYTVENLESTTASNLYVTIEDAPIGWDVTSPGVFDLAAGESRDIEITIVPNENADANVTVALFKESLLLREDSIELSQAVLHGTGLITFGGDSILFGLIILLGFVIAYVVYTKREEIESGEFAPWTPIIEAHQAQITMIFFGLAMWGTSKSLSG